VRTTVTLDADVEALIGAVMREKDMTFKQVINEAIRTGLTLPAQNAFRQRTFALGFRPEINYDRALSTAAALEDEDLLHKLALGK